MAIPPLLLQAIVSGNAGQVQLHLNQTPADLTSTDDTGRTLLHHAAKNAKLTVVQELLNQGADVHAVDAKANTPLHEACAIETKGDPVAIVQELLNGGASLLPVNQQGWTAVHLAAFTGKLACLQELELDGNHAAASGADPRGWTLFDIATAAGKTAIEDHLVVSGQFAAPVLALPGGGPHSTIDVIVAATTAEDPALLVGLRQHLEDLYRYPEFRGVLDMAAADALASRVPGAVVGGRRGLRIFLGQSDFAGDLTGRGGYGAFDDASNTLAMGTNRPVADLVGTIIHELTHHAADVVYGQNAVPYDQENDPEAIAYRDAIEADTKLESLSRYVSGEVGEVSDTITARVSDYATKAPGQDMKRLRVLQEYIAGVPQAIVQHGVARATDVAPNLVAFFQNEFRLGCEGAANAHVNFQNTVDNTALLLNVGAPPVPTPLAPSFADLTGNIVLGNDATFAGAIVDVCRSQHGVKDPPPANGPVAGLDRVVYMPVLLRMPEDANGTLGAKQDGLRDALATLRAEMPPELTRERLGKLMSKGAEAFHQGNDQASVGRAFVIEGRKQIRKGKVEYLERAAGLGTLTEQLVAETVVYEAAARALDADANRAGLLDPTLGPDMKDAKLQKLVRTLARKITPTHLTRYAQNPAEFQNAVTSLLGTHNGVFTKAHGRWQNSVLKQSPEHVSIELKDAKRSWVAHLATL